MNSRVRILKHTVADNVQKVLEFHLLMIELLISYSLNFQDQIYGKLYLVNLKVIQ